MVGITSREGRDGRDGRDGRIEAKPVRHCEEGLVGPTKQSSRLDRDAGDPIASPLRGSQLRSLELSPRLPIPPILPIPPLQHRHRTRCQVRMRERQVHLDRPVRGDRRGGETIEHD